MRFVVISLSALLGLSPAAVASPDMSADFQTKTLPLLKRYCYECHGDGASSGDLDMDRFKTLADIRGDKPTVAKIIRYARTQVMPPPDAEKALSLADRDALADALMVQLYDLDPKHPDPGPMVLRRLNQTEYRNTIRDLTGVSFDPALDFPQDDTGYGFDNIADVLTLPPMLLEKYLKAADKIMEEAIPPADNPKKKMTEPMRKLFVRYAGQRAASTTQPVNFDSNVARAILTDFARRGWRRPPRRDEIDRLLKLYDLARRNDETFHGSIRHAMKAVIVSPSFLFRGDVSADPARNVRPVSEYELATRLSYFLWSTMPDDELLDLASRNLLRRSLDAQVKRMVASPKAHGFVENFAGQWLQFRNLDAAHPDGKKFEIYDDRLRDSMRRETEMFFESILKDDRNPLEILTADYTFVNGRLAKFYGIPNVDPGMREFKRVSLEGTKRRGILTQASILTLTSNPTRTSPVKRGKWVLESLLGVAPPPPPPDIPALESGKQLTGSLRQRTEQHRADPNCASCHAPMDPIGFGLENFDAIGRWRDSDGPDKIDASSSFTDGSKFNGPGELVELLARTRQNDFYRALTEAAMTYALGRGVEPYDQPAIDRITAQLRKPDAKFSTLLIGVIDSAPFQMRRADNFQRTASLNGMMNSVASRSDDHRHPGETP